MDSLPKSTSSQGPQHLEPFNHQSAHSSSPYQHNEYYDPATPYHLSPKVLDHQVSPNLLTPPTTELTTLTPKGSLCPLCKGKKYGFTAYFHNPTIFPSPPHELLPLIEKSYVLKNRLKSLLVTYIMREAEHNDLQEAEREVMLWSSLVEELLGEIVNFASGMDREGEALDEVSLWTRSMAGKVRGSLMGARQMDMPKGRMDEILVQFRELWEGVWRQFLRERKNNEAGEEYVQAGVS